MAQEIPDTPAREMLNRMLPLLRSKDLDALADLYAADGVHELPFPPPGAPRRIDGREQIRAYFSALRGTALEFNEFRPVAVHDTGDPHVVVAEYDAHGVVSSSGQAFAVRYVWVLEVSGGEIACWRDYWNPAEIMALQTD